MVRGGFGGVEDRGVDAVATNKHSAILNGFYRKGAMLDDWIFRALMNSYCPYIYSPASHYEVTINNVTTPSPYHHITTNLLFVQYSHAIAVQRSVLT